MKVKRLFVIGLIAAFTAMTFLYGVLAAPTTTNLVVTPGSPGFDAKNVVGVVGDAAPGYSDGSIRSGGATKTDVYFAPESIFGRAVTLGEVKNMSYWTKTGATHGVDPRDWFLAIYTKPYAGDVSAPGWYGDRIGAEPYFSSGLADPAGTWNQWTTDGAANRLRFFESTQGAPGATFGSYTDPDWDTRMAGNALSGDPYGGHAILFWSIQTGSDWAAGFNGQVDGFRIELTDGSVATVNFEPLMWKGQNWDHPTNGTAVVDGSGNMVLNRASGTADVQIHLNRILPMAGSDSFINQNGTPWVEFSYIDNGQYRGIDMLVDDETMALNPRLQAGSLFACQGLGYLRFGSGAPPLFETFGFGQGCDLSATPGTIGSIRAAGQPHTIYVGQRSDGTIDYRYDGTWFTSTFLKDNVGAFDFNDIYLRLRGAAGTSATFTDFRYGDNHRAEQAITFGTLADKTYGDADFTVSATASSGLPVAYGAAGDCTVTGDLVHITGAGSCTITASQAGDGTFAAAADVDQSFNIGQAASLVTITCPASVPFNGSAQTPCTATVTGAGGLNQAVPVTYTNNVFFGTATASASYAGDANHTASSASKTFLITANPPASANACKNGGWQFLTRLNGTTFKNQGDCVSYTKNGK